MRASRLRAVRVLGRVERLGHRDALAPAVADVGDDPDEQGVAFELQPERSAEGGDERSATRRSSTASSFTVATPSGESMVEAVMDFELSEEQEAFRKVVREFAEAEIAPHVETWDRTHEFPVDTVTAMGDLGLFGLIFPPEYGGSGADFTTFCVALEELGRVDQSMAITVEAGVGLGANPIFQFGTEAQRQQWLPDLCAGRRIGGFGLTEPDAGSDAGGTRTAATLDDDATSG